MKRLRILLYTLTILNVTATSTILRYTAPPYTVVGLTAVLIVDLLLRSSLKRLAAAACYTSCERGAANGTRALRKAVVLQLWFWKARLLRYAIAFLPAVCLQILSDRIHLFVRSPYDPAVIAAVFSVFSYIFLLLGIAMVEFFMFRYMAAWYLLPFCERAGQAVRWAKNLAAYRLEEVAELCLCTPAFSAVRATWVEQQILRSKHAYNFLEKTKTDNGTFRAEIQNNGG